MEAVVWVVWEGTEEAVAASEMAVVAAVAMGMVRLEVEVVTEAETARAVVCQVERLVAVTAPCRAHRVEATAVEATVEASRVEAAREEAAEED